MRVASRPGGGDLGAREEGLDLLHAHRQDQPVGDLLVELGRDGHELEDAGRADEAPQLVLVLGARQLDRDAVLTLGDDDRLRDADGVDAVLDDRARLLEDVRRHRLCIGRHDLVLAAQAADEVEAEARLEHLSRLAAESRQGQDGGGERQHEDDDDQDGKGPLHRRDDSRPPVRARPPAAGPCGYASRCARIRSARPRPMPGTAAISSTLALRSTRLDPNTRSSARLRAGPTPGQVVERRPGPSLGAHLAVVGDGEAVGLVAQALDQVERLRRRGQHDRVAATGQEQLLALLGEARQRQVVEAELVEHRRGRR